MTVEDSTNVGQFIEYGGDSHREAVTAICFPTDDIPSLKESTR